MFFHQKILQMLSGIDAKKLKESMSALQEFSKTPEGKDFLSKFQGVDQEELLKKINEAKLDTGVVDDFSKKLQALDQEKLLSELSDQPELLGKMREYLNKQEGEENKNV